MLDGLTEPIQAYRTFYLVSVLFAAFPSKRSTLQSKRRLRG